MVDDFAQIRVSQARLEQKFDDLYVRLLGNGQPGIVQYFQSEIESTKGRVSAVEHKQYWFAGVGSTLGAIVGFVAKKYF